MLSLSPAEPLRRVLAIGCHADDIEIGCGGTLLSLARGQPGARGRLGRARRRRDARADEARASAADFLAGCAVARVEVHEFRDGFLPYVGGEVKDVFEELKGRVDPQIVFTHAGYDLHQDHRLACELTWNTFRNHLILEYEIPKVRRRPRPAERLRPARRRRRGAEARAARATLPEPGRQALVRPRDVRRPDAAPRDGGRCAERYRGGVHRAKGRARRVKFVEWSSRARTSSSPSATRTSGGSSPAPGTARSSPRTAFRARSRSAASRATPRRDAPGHALPDASARGGEARPLHDRRNLRRDRRPAPGLRRRSSAGSESSSTPRARAPSTSPRASRTASRRLSTAPRSST